MATPVSDSVILSEPRVHSSAPQVDPAACLIERLMRLDGQALERYRIRRTLGEHRRILPEHEEDWRSWLIAAGRSLDLRFKPVNASVDQLIELARGGVRVILRCGADRRWLAMIGVHGRRFRVVSADESVPEQLLTKQQLRRSLHAGANSKLSVVVLDSTHRSIERHDAAEHEVDPFHRLWRLLAPERADLWIIVIFAAINGLLALATPLAVETLVNTVAFGRLMQPVIVLSLLLLGFLALSSAIRAVQTYAVEIIQRRLFARVAADLAYRLPRVQTEAMGGQSGRELVNRFFDVVTVQKASAQLLLDAVGLALSALIGMLVLALYHPWLLGFDVVLLVLVALTLFVMGRGAVATSIEESKAKYGVAAWLEDLAAARTTFRDGFSAEFALASSDRLIHKYLKARQKHFRVLMRQIIFALGLQAVASTVLLGMGGWLVISGQLTLGQLVAAEMIVTVIVGSVAKMGKHLESWYDLLAAVDKLGVLFDLPIEQQQGQNVLPNQGPATVVVKNLELRSAVDTHEGPMNLTIPAGARLCLPDDGSGRASRLIDHLFGMRRPQHGGILINGVDLRDLQPDALRVQVALIRNVEIFSGTIAANVHREHPHVAPQAVHHALAAVGLLDELLEFPEGLETRVTESGEPLTPNQARRLMFARAIVQTPKLLLIDGALDALPDDQASSLCRWLSAPDRPWTLVVVTAQQRILDAIQGLGSEAVATRGGRT